AMTSLATAGVHSASNSSRNSIAASERTMAIASSTIFRHGPLAVRSHLPFSQSNASGSRDDPRASSAASATAESSESTNPATSDKDLSGAAASRAEKHSART